MNILKDEEQCVVVARVLCHVVKVAMTTGLCKVHGFERDIRKRV